MEEQVKFDHKKYKMIGIRVSDFQFRKLKETSTELRIPLRNIIEQMCHRCDMGDFIIFDKKKKKSVTLPKGFLTKK